MDDRVRKRVEDRATPVEVFGLAAHHHEQLSLQGCAAPSAHRRVDDSDAAPGCVPGHVDTGVGMDVEWMATTPPGCHSLEHAVAPRRTSSTSASPITQMPTTSLAAPSSAGVEATEAAVSA